MSTELDVLRLVSDRLTSIRVPYMLTGSFAMALYVTPRMTRDLDLVVALALGDVQLLVDAFSVDFHVDSDEVRAAIESRRMFNLMHFATAIKVDIIVRRDDEYRQVEFARRQPAMLGNVSTWVVSREDLILSKLVWALTANSELQRRDVQQLLASGVDVSYLLRWAPTLGVSVLLQELMP